MSTSELHWLARDYLDRIARQAQPLPADVRRELMADINSHVREATRPDMTDFDVQTALDRLGDPDEIIAAVAPAPAPQTGRGTHEWAAIILLLAGGFLWGIGWIVGVVLLWTSSAWRTKDKLIGTFLLPGGLAALVAVLLFAGVVGGDSISVCGNSDPVSISIHQGPSVAGGTFTHTGNVFGSEAGVPAGAITLPSCHSGGPTTLAVVLVIFGLILLLAIPVLTAIYLAKRASIGRRLA